MKKFRKLFLAGWLGVSLIISGTGSVSAAKNSEDLPELKIGCGEYDPYNYIDENGGIVGADADIAAEACARMGYSPTYIILEWTQKERFLQYGIIDCIWNCFSINGREDEYLWSDPYLYSKESVLVKNDSNIYTIKELDGKIISAQANTRAEEILLDNSIAPKIMAANVYSFQKQEEAISAMKQGYVDAVAGDREYLSQAVSDSDEYRVLNENLETSKLAVAFRKNEDHELVEKLNTVLKEMRDDGTISEILKKYNIEEAEIPGEEADIEK